MTDARAQRQKAIAAILRTAPVASQEEVTERLSAKGYSVTQATVSRDLEQLGAVKVKRGGVLSYALPDQIGGADWSTARLERIIREWALSIEAAGQMIVIKTPPGSAHLVAAAVDHAQLPEIAGTVSGDDTLFLAVRDGAAMPALMARFQLLTGESKEIYV